jgi:hypothetical protein
LKNKNSSKKEELKNIIKKQDLKKIFFPNKGGTEEI